VAKIRHFLNKTIFSKKSGNELTIKKARKSNRSANTPGIIILNPAGRPSLGPSG
jgi:hypothetical protein